MPVMGFCAENRPAEKIRPVLPEEALIRFDSGRAISFFDAMRHTGVFGSNGTGKTVQVVVPAMESAIRSGAMTLIFDPKGTLAGYARAIAKACGRAGDIVEFGTTPSAMPINILEGMTQTEFFNFLMGLLDAYMDGGKSGNMDFHASSASNMRDVFRLGDFIVKEARKRGKDCSVTLPLVLELMSDAKTATAIFEKFLQTVELTDEIRSFAQQVQGNIFHPLNQKDADPDSEHQKQLNFNTQAAMQAMGGFLEENGIIEKFCRPGAQGLDISVFVGKIIILSFGAGAAGASARICRMFAESFYSWIYSQGVGGPRRFVIVDEFQEICDLSPRRLSDTSFIALAREFNVGYLLATQSYAALAARYGVAGLEALTANLNNKVFLHSEDVLTRESARALGGPDLIDLQKEAFAATYDTRQRAYVYDVETLDESFARTCAIRPVKGEPVRQEPLSQDAKSLIDVLDALKAEKAQMRQVVATEGETPERRRFMTRYDEIVNDYVEWEMAREQADREAEKRREELSPDDLRLIYSGLFRQGADISVPAGWNAFLARMLEFFSGYGIKVRIEKIDISRGCCLEASGEPYGAMRLLNNLLSLSEGLCIRCGAEIEPNAFSLCPNCQKTLPKIKGGKRCHSQNQF